MERTILALTCDRCGADEHVDDRSISKWNFFSVGNANVMLAGSIERPADLCPDCTAEVVRWFQGKPLPANPTQKPESD